MKTRFYILAVSMICATCGCAALAAADIDLPVPKPAATSGLSDAQMELLRQALNQPPGTKFEFDYSQKDGGTVKTVEEGTGKGAGATAEGDKLDGKFDGTPPKVGRGADGSQTAEGGAAIAANKASAFVPPATMMSNPLMWIGAGCLLGSGWFIYRRRPRPAFTLGGVGAGLILCAMFPGLLWFILAGVIVWFALPYIKAELEAQKGEQNKEALRAVVAGVEHSDVPYDAAKAVKAAIFKESDAVDRKAIDEVKREDKIGKYQE